MESTSVQQLSGANKGNEASTLSKRRRQSPERYGDMGQINLSGSSIDDALGLSDNSLDDINFAPSPKRIKVVATVGKPPKKITFNNAMEKTSTPAINFDDEFDLLKRSKPAVSKEAPEIVENNPAQHAAGIVLSLASKHNDFAEVLKLCEKMANQLNDISARITLIEGRMLNGLSAAKDNKSYGKIEESRIFCQSNHMPLKNLDDLNAFEGNLKKAEYRKIAVSIYYCAIVIIFNL